MDFIDAKIWISKNVSLCRVFANWVIYVYVHIWGSEIGPADPASAGPKFENYNPQSLFMSLKCILIGTC